MATRRPVEPGSTGDTGGPRRDRRGRFVTGGTRGGGAGTHAYVQRRAALAKALQEAVSPAELTTLVGRMYQLAMKGNVQAGMFLVTQLAGRAPERPSPLQLSPAVRLTPGAPLTIDMIGERVQQLLDAFAGGRLDLGDAMAERALLDLVLRVRETQELGDRLAEVEAFLRDQRERPRG